MTRGMRLLASFTRLSHLLGKIREVFVYPLVLLPVLTGTLPSYHLPLRGASTERSRLDL
jgi:hypothetical protein